MAMSIAYRVDHPDADSCGNPDLPVARVELESRVQLALTRYANVHRGSGLNSEATTTLYEQARTIVLDHLRLDASEYEVLFTSPLGACGMAAHFSHQQDRMLSSHDLGLPLGVRALAIRRDRLARLDPPRAGGGTVRMVSPDSMIWAGIPARFEAGTPAVINVIATVCAMQLLEKYGLRSFCETSGATASTESILYRDEYFQRSGHELLALLRHTMVGAGALVPTWDGLRPYRHLDAAASTPTLGPIWSTVCMALRQPPRLQAALVREVKRIGATFLGAPSEDYPIIFTANTTEAIHVAAKDLERSIPPEIEPVIVNTLLEHNSNELPWRALPRVVIRRLAVDSEGFLDLAQLEQLLREYNSEQLHGKKRIVLVSVSGASNVLGTYADLQAISRVAHRYGARVFVDAAQLAAHRRIEMKKWDIDYLALSGHKLYAPFGSAMLVVHKDIVARAPWFWERVKACGEENVAGITAIGKAMVLLQRIGLETLEAEERRLTARLVQGLSRIPNLEIWGTKDLSSPRMQQRGGIVAFSMKHVPHNRIALELAERGGIGVRTGCHCAHLLVKELLGIHPLRAKAADLSLWLLPNLTSVVLPGLVRASLGLYTDDDDVDHFLRTVEEVALAPRSWVDRFWASGHNGTPFLGASPTRKRSRRAIAELVAAVYGD